MSSGNEWDELARTKLIRVLGASEGEIVFTRTLTKLGKYKLRTPSDVYLFAQILKHETSVIAAVGSMLALTAVIRGADPAKLDELTQS